MENNQLLPFERNRFYGGKLLTSADFQAEQTYFNNKRRFLNKLLFGPGILCGLSVFNLDDLSVMVESGAALDGAGRELVIGQSVIRKLSAIEGFDTIKTDEAALCLKYREEETHPVYVEGRGDEEGKEEYNRCREDWQLFLMDWDHISDEYRQEEEFFSTASLCEEEACTVTLRLPATVCRGKRVKALLRVERKSEEPGSLELDMTLGTPAFLLGEDRHELIVHTGLVHLEPGQVFEREYWLLAGEDELEETTLFAGEDDISIIIDGDEIKTEAVNLKTSIRAISPQELVTRESGRMSLEMREMENTRDEVVLACLSLSRSENACLIEGLTEAGVKRYIPTPAGEALRREYAAWFMEGSRSGRTSQLKRIMEQSMTVSASPPQGEISYASGIVEIPLGNGAKKGSIHYSGEIVHGLGSGNVIVTTGLASLEGIPGQKEKGQSTVFGDVSLFEVGKGEGKLPVQTAVRVFNDRGCFLAAVRLLKETSAFVLTLQWTAVRLPESEAETGKEYAAGASITAKTPTAVMKPGDSHYFEVYFNNLDPCSLTYSMTEEGSGVISESGVYTAPSREGVYELQIACLEKPEIYTYAYAVVVQEGKTS